MFELLEKIKKEQDNFSTAQRLVAAYVVENYYQIPFMSISTLSKNIGVSDTTVVNFCAHLGFSKFTEFKKVFSSFAHSELTMYNTLSDSVQGDLDHQNLFSIIQEEECANVTATLSNTTNQINLPPLLSMMHGAKRIYITGGRASLLLAERMTLTLRYLGLPVTCIGGGVGDYIDQFSQVTSEDLVIAFAFPRYTTMVVNMLKELHGHAVPIVLITDEGLSPAYPYAQLAFHCAIHSTGFLASHASAHSLIDVISRAYAQKHISNASQAVKALEEDLLRAGVFL